MKFCYKILFPTQLFKPKWKKVHSLALKLIFLGIVLAWIKELSHLKSPKFGILVQF